MPTLILTPSRPILPSPHAMGIPLHARCVYRCLVYRRTAYTLEALILTLPNMTITPNHILKVSFIRLTSNLCSFRTITLTTAVRPLKALPRYAPTWYLSTILPSPLFFFLLFLPSHPPTAATSFLMFYLIHNTNNPLKHKDSRISLTTGKKSKQFQEQSKQLPGPCSTRILV